MNDEASVSSQQKVFDVTFATKNELYRAWMPFVKQGALFIRINQEGKIGEKIALNIKLPDDPNVHSTQGKVVWTTPKGAQGAKHAGLGIEFGEENAEQLRHQIEKLLAGMLKSGNKTDTM